MKKTRGIIRIISILVCPFILGGCLAAITIGTALWVGGTVAEMVEEIKKADLRKAVAADFETTEAAVKSSFEALGIEIKEVKRNEKGDGGEIIGLTAAHRKIRILMAQATSQTTEMGIWAEKKNYDRDPEFASLISQQVDKELSPAAKPRVEIQ